MSECIGQKMVRKTEKSGQSSLKKFVLKRCQWAEEKNVEEPTLVSQWSHTVQNGTKDIKNEQH